jgi:endonuclease YncB( thermonuclease family)
MAKRARGRLHSPWKSGAAAPARPGPAQQQTHLRLCSTVKLKPETIDRYGRTVAEVTGEINLGLAMVEDGQAFAYRKYLDQCNAQEYLVAEYRASRRRYGLWQVPGGIARPWEF